MIISIILATYLSFPFVFNFGLVSASATNLNGYVSRFYLLKQKITPEEVILNYPDENSSLRKARKQSEQAREELEEYWEGEKGKEW